MKRLFPIVSECTLEVQTKYSIKRKVIYSIFSLGLLYGNANAQTMIQGILLDRLNNKPIPNVTIRNIHTKTSIQSDSNGQFNIIVRSDDLLNFNDEAFNNLNIRINNEKTPSYYKIHLEPKKLFADVHGKTLPYKLDSLEYDNTYGIIIHGERKDDVDKRALPLAALSKANRDKWAFQEMYDKWQSEKFIDFSFNKELIKSITFLEGRELEEFMHYYRPSYNFLRSATEYEYLNYIKQSYLHFTNRNRY